MTACLGECEGLVGYKLEAGSVHLSGTLCILSFQLLKQGIIDPQIDVTLPVALLISRWGVGYCPLIYLYVDLLHWPMCLAYTDR